MTETRGRSSKVDKLPAELKVQLDSWLRDKSMSQAEILKQVNLYIEEFGLPEADKLSRSGLNRYASSMEVAGSKIRQAREISKQWIGQLGDTPEGEVSKILIEMVRTLAFDSVMKATESDEPVAPKFIKDLSVGIEKLEKAASESLKREQEIERLHAEKLAKELEKQAKAGSLPQTREDMVEFFKNDILGLNQ